MTYKFKLGMKVARVTNPKKLWGTVVRETYELGASTCVDVRRVDGQRGWGVDHSYATLEDFIIPFKLTLREALENEH